MRGQDLGNLGKTLGLVALLGSPIGCAITPVYAQSSRVFFDDFENGLTHHWKERKLAGKSARYEVVQEGDNAVLVGSSNRSATMLWQELDLREDEIDKITWRWKIENTISGNRREREKSGDDYVARLFVVFDPDGFGPKTEAICYVWAANEPVGAIYVNPYFDRVAMIVVESGNQRAGQWVTEERDLVWDHWNAFGKPPKTVSTVAIMVDTDDTDSEATAWFDDVGLIVGETAPAPRRPALEEGGH